MRSTEPFGNFTPWNESLTLNKEVYSLTATFPEEEKTGLVARFRDCSLFIAITISKFVSNRISPEMEAEVNMAVNKIFELEAMLRIALSLNYINNADLDNMLEKNSTGKAAL